jgi:hypothetical protein
MSRVFAGPRQSFGFVVANQASSSFACRALWRGIRLDRGAPFTETLPMTGASCSHRRSGVPDSRPLRSLLVRDHQGDPLSARFGIANGEESAFGGFISEDLFDRPQWYGRVRLPSISNAPDALHHASFVLGDCEWRMERNRWMEAAE